MATKDIVLRKRLIRQGIFIVVGLSMLIAIGVGLSGYDDDAQSEKTAATNANNSLHEQHDSIQQELGEGFDVNGFYAAYFRKHVPNFKLDRESAAAWMSVTRERNHLANFSLAISPVTDVAQDFMHFKNNILTKSDVNLTFGAITDTSIYNFITALESSLPGLVLIKDLKFARTGDLSSTLVTALSQHRIMPIVTGEITFVWLGLHPIEDPNAKPGSAQGGHNGQ